MSHESVDALIALSTKGKKLVHLNVYQLFEICSFSLYQYMPPMGIY